MKRIILASASPRRRELLEKIGLGFEVEPGAYVEEVRSNLDPRELAKAISRGKALAVASKHQNAIVIAADTFVVSRGKIMGKPKTEAEAKEMLQAISGGSHSVITGFTILDTDEDIILSQAV